MKYLFFFILITLNFSILAETAEEAFAREKNFLIAQKESLINLKKSMNISKESRKKKAELEIKKLQTDLALISLKNQELLEEFKAIEKITKDSSQLNSQLEKNYLKISELFSDVAPKLGLSYQETLGNDPVLKFESALNSVFGLIEQFSKFEWKEHAFLNEDEKLVKGEILFIGLHSAWGKYQGKVFSLAPFNKDFLKVIPNTDKTSLFLFPTDFQKVKVMSAKTWKESIADSIPGIVMLIIMFAVFGLFIMLART